MPRNRFFSPLNCKHGNSENFQVDEHKTGLLLVNLGTPEAPTTKAVRVYLRQFLNDPRVIEPKNYILWSIVVNCFILPFRPKKSAQLYKNIWTKDGSPLLVNTKVLSKALDEELTKLGKGDFLVDFAMSYGKPTLKHALRNLVARGAKRLLIIPLYPQYSGATTASVFDGVCQELKTWRYLPELHFVNTFHNHTLYISGLAESVRTQWRDEKVTDKAEKLIMSFHGIPERYVKNGDPYYDYCQKTGHLLAKELGLNKEGYHITFQSKFGKEPWVTPSTNETLKTLASTGVKSVDVICPGFFSDCLETLDEITRESRDLFKSSGGEVFRYIPCLNASRAAVKLLAGLVEEHISNKLSNT